MKKNYISIIILAVTLITAISIFATSKDKSTNKKKAIVNSTKQIAVKDSQELKDKNIPQKKLKNIIQTFRIYKASNKYEGIIGNFKNNKSDNPSDNIFHITIDKDLSLNTSVYLEYELYGLQDFTSVCRSVNDQLTTGGYFVKKSEGWSKQSEQLSIKQLKQGENIIRFTVPENAEYAYKVRNVCLLIKPAISNESRRLVVNQPNTFTFFQKFGYLQGFVTGKGCETAQLKVNGKAFTNNNGNFEGLADKTTPDSNAWKATVTATFEDGMQLKTEINFQKPAQFDYTYNLNNHINQSQQLAEPDKEIYFKHQGLQLTGKILSVKNSVQLSATSLRSVDMPPMGSGMVNVTGESKGYRLLPHGTQFENELKLAIKYDTTLLPKGYRASDIRTYYFDEKVNNWVIVPIDTIDKTTCMVISRTHHFSDYINAIIKVPELPETQAYTPTSLKDIKAANPISGLNLISPPSANNMGTANISFPIEIPSGRQGMQPSLALQYNSGGGNGWLGVGWDLPISSITVENRWGVPTYRTDVESEDYLLSGEQIAPALPEGVVGALVHRAAFVNRDTSHEKQFVPRIEGAFSKIVRHGSNPKNYWWTVTDRNGITNYYGKYSSLSTNSPTTILADDNGNIAHWALTETRDLHGNYVKYEYDTVQSTGLTFGSVKGRQIYIKKITYTCFNNSIDYGKYSVEFERLDSLHQRTDVQISGRYGFKEVTADLLNTITIRYNNTIIKKYFLGYKDGEFNKNLLCGIAEITTDNLDFLNMRKLDVCEYINDLNYDTQCNLHLPAGILIHRFDYFEKNNQKFTSEQVINSINDDISGKNFVKVSASGLGLTTGSSLCIGGGAGGGLGNPASKTLSGEGNYNYSNSESEGRLTLIDLNGDGLPDKVYLKNGIKCRLMLKNGNGYKFSETEYSINGINNTLKENSYSDTYGGEGHLAIMNISGQSSTTDSYTSIYFADVNADGYIDVIDNGEVYFNKLNQFGRFEKKISDTVYIGDNKCNFIIHSGEINDSLLMIANREFITPKIDNAHESVRMWIVPYSGIININAPIQLLEDTSKARKQSHYVNGIKYIIQHNDSVIYNDTIQKNNYQFKYYNQNYSVCKGDMLFFRLQSNGNRSFDVVNWNPIIKYINKDTISLDSDGKKIHVFNASEDFLLNMKSEIGMPLKGKIKIYGNITSPPLSDTIKLQVFKNNSILVKEVNFIDNNTINYNLYDSLSVDTNDLITINVKSNTNVNWSSLKCNLYLEYMQSDSVVFDTICFLRMKPNVHYSMYQEILIPSYPHLLNIDTFTLRPLLTYNANISYGNLIVAVKKNHKIIAKKKLIIQNNKFIGDSTLVFNVNSTTDKYYFDFYIDSNNISNKISTVNVKILNNIYAAGLFTVCNDSLSKFGNLYRGWGQFCYNDSSSIQINRKKLYLKGLNYANYLNYQNPSDFDTNHIKNIDSLYNYFNNNNLINPLFNEFSIMTPDLDSNVWRGFGDLTMVSAGIMSNSRKKLNIDRVFDYPFPLINGKIGLAPLKWTQTESKSFSSAVGLSIFNAGSSFTNSRTKTNLDFVDINGDRYPDFVGRVFAITTLPQGGFGNYLVHNNLDIYGINYNISNAKGTNFGGSYPKSLKTTIGNPSKSKLTVEANGSLSHGNGNSFDYSEYTLTDINGDGLPDKYIKGGYIALNLGNSFAYPESWIYDVTFPVKIGNSNNKSNNLGFSNQFNIFETSFAGGIGGSKSENNSVSSVIDINGDGLQDVIIWKDTNNIRYLYVSFNTGNGFKPFEIWASFDNIIEHSKTFNESINIAATIGFPLPIFAIPFKIIGNFGISYSQNSTIEKVQLIDINDDGYPDYVISDNEGSIKVHYSTLGKLNILKKVTNSIGSSFEMDYSLSDNSVRSPQRSWLLSSVQINDGHKGDGCDSTLTTFEYKNPFYERSERISFGYDTVITRVKNAMVDHPYTYRCTIERFHNDKYLFKGIKNYELLLDSLYRKQVETFYTYKAKRISSGAEVPDSMMNCYTDYYPAISKEDKYFYEGQPDYSIHTQKQYTHGRWGNVTIFKEMGDLADNGDDLTAFVSYDTIVPLNLLTLQKQLIVKHINDIMQSRSATYNQSNGKQIQISLNNTNTTTTFDFNYDMFGNKSSVILPENQFGQRKVYYYSYENNLFTYPESVWDEQGYKSSAWYNYNIGKPILTIDISGNKTEFTYDGYGRTKTVSGPYEIANNVPYTIKFDYWDDYFHINPFNGISVPWARTRHYDPQNSGNEITSVLFTDGLGRELQLKKKSTIYDPVNNIENDSMIVSGRVTLDPYGRAMDTYYPITEALGSDSLFNYNISPLPPTHTVYDVMDRAVSVTTPDQKTTTMYYGFDVDYTGINKFATIQLDALGKMTESFRDARNLNSSVRDALNGITKFEYNPSGELISTTDPENNVTTHTYDMLGRKIKRQHPDAGITTYEYDPAGNIIAMTTQNLSNQSTKILYKYDYNQLIGIEYPLNPENNVFYKYGDPYSGNQAGRIIIQQDASGVQEFSYGKLGELTKNIHTFVMPAGETYTFETQWSYDTWNRLNTIIYPDGEKVNYKYNNGGQLLNMSGEKSGKNFSYINYLGYDKYEKRLRIDYGNNTYTNYQYNPLNLQLSNLTSYNSFNEEMQNIDYTYDNVNNITAICNTAQATSNAMGGQYCYNYEYDDNYRLKSSNGDWLGNSFDLIMQYSASGNITEKIQKANININGNNSLLDYKRIYNYGSNQPHTVEHINNNEIDFRWDANGNLLSINSPNENLLRYHCWDEENRLTAVKDQNYLSHYIYDAGGERVWKITGEVQRMQINKEDYIDYADLNNITLYANPYFVVNDKEYSKHFYIEGQRICSKLGNGLANSPVDFTTIVGGISQQFRDDLRDRIYRNNECVNHKAQNVNFNERLNSLERLHYTDKEEHDLFFYHSDHLGSSSFITDASGITIQHLQYLPYGELFVEQRGNANYFTPYKFSAKEKDEETSYSYFGARYLASDFSFWLSVDPMADKYPNISPYAYCAWNPVMLVDPDGRDLVITGEASDKAVNQLQNKTNLKLTRNNENGKISYEGEAKTKADKRLAKIIDDKKITTNIIAKNTNQVNENAQTNEYGGAYMGNEVKKDENGNITSVYANQFVNPDVIGYWDKKTESEIGTGMLHEVVEAYAGGEIALKTGVSSPDSRYIKTTTYELAHKIANKIAPGDIIKEVHRYSNPVSFNLSKDIFGRMQFQPVYEKIKFRRTGN